MKNEDVQEHENQMLNLFHTRLKHFCNRYILINDTKISREGCRVEKLNELYKQFLYRLSIVINGPVAHLSHSASRFLSLLQFPLRRAPHCLL